MGTDKRDAQGRRLTEWMGRDPKFAPDAPPKDWERQFDRMHVAPVYPQERANVVLVEGRYYNKPVPKRASCHYYRLDTDPRNFYMY